jgi:hypothetical protein
VVPPFRGTCLTLCSFILLLALHIYPLHDTTHLAVELTKLSAQPQRPHGIPAATRIALAYVTCRRALEFSTTGMANSLVVHGAIFAVGALVGGGIVTTIARKNEHTSFQSVARPQQPVPPIVQVGTTGKAVITSDVGVVSPPLKYGNPGMWLPSFCEVRSYACDQGQLPTSSSAKPMWLGTTAD